MEALHKHGGVPPGWQFTLPEGESAAGRQAFIDMRCHTCHTLTGEQLPPVTPAERSPGPDLAGMGAHHPAAYFAESILNPNAVVVLGPGYTTADGRSIMPTEYVNLLTVRQLLDLVAYLQSLRTPPPQQRHGSDAHTHQPPGLQPPQGGGHTSHTPAK
jgi:mono/diheme cytochrome c family protein